MRYDIVDPTGIDRLFKLIERRDGHWLAMQVEDSKIALTEQDARPIDLSRLEDGLVAELTRALFEGAIEPLLEIGFDHRVQGQTRDLRPGLPLLLHW
jgi:hypothetical chaperone protein